MSEDKSKLSNCNFNSSKSYFGLILLKFLPIERYLIDLFFDIELITFVTSISNPLSLRSKPLIHLIPPKANSRTVAPLDLSSLELRSMRTSIAISLHANPKSIALRASAGNRLDERFSVLRATVDVKKALKD